MLLFLKTSMAREKSDETFFKIHARTFAILRKHQGEIYAKYAVDIVAGMHSYVPILHFILDAEDKEEATHEMSQILYV